MIGIVAALPLEARCLLGRKVKPGERISLDDAGWMQVSGIGREKARSAAYSLLDAGATALLSWGVSGGLDPQLLPGTLVLPRQIHAADRNLFPVDEAWRRRIHACVFRHVRVSDGALIEALAVIASPAQKRSLAQASGAVAVDMESAAVGQAAKQAGVPFVAVRAVVDTADSTLPRSVLRANDEYGRLRIAKLLFSLISHPADLGALIGLSKNFRAAQATLQITARLAGPKLCLQ